MGSGCASLPEDYTPQIHVAPGAAVRSRWIQSKNVAGEPDAEADGEGEEGEASKGEPFEGDSRGAAVDVGLGVDLRVEMGPEIVPETGAGSGSNTSE